MSCEKSVWVPLNGFAQWKDCGFPHLLGSLRDCNLSPLEETKVLTQEKEVPLVPSSLAPGSEKGRRWSACPVSPSVKAN